MRHRSSPSSLRDSKQLRAKKHLGQNFLIDPNAVGRIIQACDLSNEETVLEIGPGTGALTRQIAANVKKVMAVEKDAVLADLLKKEFLGRNVEIIHGDFLELDLEPLLKKIRPVKVIGNLPYYISTPILTRVIEERQYFKEFFLTVQKEFAQRLGARHDTKEYGSLTCFVQYYSQVDPMFHIKSTCFRPRPKVDSSFLKLTIRESPEHPCRDEQFLFEVIRRGFNQRRKTLLNALSGVISKDRLAVILESLGLSVQSRAEQLNLEKFVLLSENIQKSCGSPDVI